MASALPTIQVLLDDGTGTYATDVTSRVSLSSGVSVGGHGRPDEFTTASPATFTCTLKNDDGGLTAGIGGFGLGPFGGSPFGGGGTISLYPGQGIRYKVTKNATTSTAFTGRISELPLEWVGGVAKSARITLTAVDPLANLALRPLRSMLEQEILVDSPTAYYTLSEATGSTTAGDSSGSQAASLAVTGTGAAMTFGAATGPGVDGLTAATFAGGQYLRATPSAPVTPAALEFCVTTTSTADMALFADGTSSPFIQMLAGLLSTGFGFSRTISDGLVHHFVLVAGVGFYFDGVFIASPIGTLPSITSLNVGGSSPSAATSWVGSVSHVALYAAAPSAARVAAHYAVIAGTPETTAQRFVRIASYAGITASGGPANSGVLMGAQATSGVTVFDALQQVADAEGGVFFANGSGSLIMQGHVYRAEKTTPTLTVPTKDIVPSSAVVTWDTQQIVNSVTATRTAGATQTVTDADSIATYGLYAQSLDLALASDANVLAAAQWMVGKHADPVQRMGSVTVNLLTSAIADQFLASEVGDHWSLATLPSQAWTGAGELSVEGWSETLTVTASGAEWSRTVNLLPWSLFSMFVLDSATYGVLDGLTPIG